MSHTQNTRFIESKFELFEDAMFAGNYELAEAHIKDIRDLGFAHEADLWEKELLAQPLSQFIIPSPMKV